MRLFVKILVSTVLAALIGIGGFTAATLFQINHNMTTSDTAQALFQTVAADREQPKEPERVETLPSDFYMLLLGVDSDENRETGDEAILYDGTFRSDSIILAHVNTTSKDVSLCSFERDIETIIDGYEENGYYKLNAAYALGGVDLMKTEVKELAGVDIPFHAVVDMDGLVEIIDSIGGIDVDVEDAFYDYQLQDGIDQGGLQHLDGHQAIVYCRSRYAWDDGDFARARHQREVLQAMAHKLMQDADLLTLYNAANTISQHVATNMDLGQIYELAEKMKGFDAENHMYSMMTPTISSYDGDQYYEELDEISWQAILKVFIDNDGGELEEKLAGNVNAEPTNGNVSGRSDLEVAEDVISSGQARNVTDSGDYTDDYYGSDVRTTSG